jgi:hypothetical protein
MSTTGRSGVDSHRDERVICEAQENTHLNHNPLTRTYNALGRELPNRSLPDLRRQALPQHHQTQSELSLPVSPDRGGLPSSDSSVRLILLGKTGNGESVLH